MNNCDDLILDIKIQKFRKQKADEIAFNLKIFALQNQVQQYKRDIIQKDFQVIQTHTMQNLRYILPMSLGMMYAFKSLTVIPITMLLSNQVLFYIQRIDVSIN